MDGLFRSAKVKVTKDTRMTVKSKKLQFYKVENGTVGKPFDMKSETLRLG